MNADTEQALETDAQPLEIPPEVSFWRNRLLNPSSAVDALTELCNHVVNRTSNQPVTSGFVDEILTNFKYSKPGRMAELLKLFFSLAESGGIPVPERLPRLYLYLGFFLLNQFFTERTSWLATCSESITFARIRFSVTVATINSFVQRALKEVELASHEVEGIEDPESRAEIVTSFLASSQGSEPLGWIESLERWITSMQRPSSRKEQVRAQSMIIDVGFLLNVHDWFPEDTPNPELSSVVQVIMKCRGPADQNLVIRLVRRAFSSHSSVFTVNHICERVLQDFQRSFDPSLDRSLQKEIDKLQPLPPTAGTLHQGVSATRVLTKKSKKQRNRKKIEGGSTPSIDQAGSPETTSSEATPHFSAETASQSSSRHQNVIASLASTSASIATGTDLKRLRDASTPGSSLTRDPDISTSSTSQSNFGIDVETDQSSTSMNQDQDVSNTSSNLSIKPSRKKAATKGKARQQESQAQDKDESKETSSSEPCWFFLKGKCTRGEDCKFSHSVDVGVGTRQRLGGLTSQHPDYPDASHAKASPSSQSGSSSSFQEDVNEGLEFSSGSRPALLERLEDPAEKAAETIQLAEEIDRSRAHRLQSKMEKEEKIVQGSSTPSTAEAGEQASVSTDGLDSEDDRKEEVEKPQMTKGGSSGAGFENRVEESHLDLREDWFESFVAEATGKSIGETSFTSHSGAKSQIGPHPSDPDTAALPPAPSTSSVTPILSTATGSGKDPHNLREIVATLISDLEKCQKMSTDFSIDSYLSFSSLQLLQKELSGLNLRNKGNRPTATEVDPPSESGGSSSTSILKAAWEKSLSKMSAEAEEGLGLLNSMDTDQYISNGLQDVYKVACERLEDWIRASSSVRNLVPASNLLIELSVDRCANKAALLLPSPRLAALIVSKDCTHLSTSAPNFAVKLRDLRVSLLETFSRFQKEQSRS